MNEENKTGYTSFEITENDVGRRIDRIIRKMFPDVSLSNIYKAIRKGDITLNKKKIKPKEITRQGDIIIIYNGFLEQCSRKLKPDVIPSVNEMKGNTKLSILYENRHVLAINKPGGVLVHGEDSLESRVKLYLAPVIPVSLSFKPGPVHRLDRNTSGLIFFAKSLKGAQLLSRIFKENRCNKYYIGLFDGRIDEEIEWRDRIFRDRKSMKTYSSSDPAAAEAVTTIVPLISKKRHTLALCILKTGITHQIRAQGLLHQHPLTGDKKYESKHHSVHKTHYILHSWGIRFHNYYREINRTLITAPLSEGVYKKLNSVLGEDFLKTALNRAQKRIKKNTIL